jgi:hypothetical protein
MQLCPMRPRARKICFRDAPSGSTVGRHADSICAGDLRETEVENFRVATLRDEDIGGLDVAVNDPFRVRCVESIRHFYRDLKQAIHFHRLARDQVLQCCAIEILHDDECLPVLLADIVNRADVGMIQCGSGFGFTTKSFQGLTVMG